MAIALPTVLQPGVVNGTISELKVNNTRLQNFFVGGGGTIQQSGRYFSWDIFNETREVEDGRAPATGPARVVQQSVGMVQGAFPRVHSSLQLDYETIHNMRKIGSLEVDRRGESWVLKQEQYLAQRYANHRELQFMGMVRGAYYYTRTGDNLKVSLSSGAVEIDFQLRAGNLAKLDMLGAGDILAASWATDTTDIPLHLSQIDEAMEVLTGRTLEHIWITSKDFNYVLNNTKVKGLAGTANVVFDEYERSDQNDLTCRLKGIPMYQWHITNGVVSLDGTTTRVIPQSYAMFCPSPDPSWIQLGEGSEVVVEYPGATPTERFGAYFYAEPTTKPAGYELIGVMNTFPFLYVPACLALGNIVY